MRNSWTRGCRDPALSMAVRSTPPRPTPRNRQKRESLRWCAHHARHRSTSVGGWDHTRFRLETGPVAQRRQPAPTSAHPTPRYRRQSPALRRPRHTAPSCRGPNRKPFQILHALLAPGHRAVTRPARPIPRSRQNTHCSPEGRREPPERPGHCHRLHRPSCARPGRYRPARSTIRHSSPTVQVVRRPACPAPARR